MNLYNIGCICNKCYNVFLLTADDYNTKCENVSYLSIKSCESGGVYAVYVECPKCKHNHELM